MKIYYETNAGRDFTIPHVVGVVRNGSAMIMCSWYYNVDSYTGNQKVRQFKETLLIHSAWHFCK